MVADPNFFDNYGPFSLEEIAKISQAKIYLPSEADDDICSSLLIEELAPLETAGESQISVFNNPKHIETFKQSKASACFIEEKYINVAPPHMILMISENPYKAYALTAAASYPKEDNNSGGYISPLAFIEESASIGEGCYIEPYVHIGPGAIIGNNTKISANTVIGRGVIIGENCIISSNVTINYAIISDNVHIYPGVRIGQDGFGFASDAKGHYKVPQLGRVIIKNNVEIGANTCIDRGSGNDTIIGENCMIDNLVQIGHNVQLGNNCVVVAQVGIAGSSKIGNYTVIGGQVGIAGHLNIGTASQIAAQSGVIKDIPTKGKYGGYPAVPIRQWHRQTALLKKLVKHYENNNE